jgi:prepilin-type processing-associated H-X9-DG protein
MINCDIAPYLQADGTIKDYSQVQSNILRLKTPNKTLLLIDGTYANTILGEIFRTDPSYTYASVRYRHSYNANILFLDNHVESTERPAPGEYIEIARHGGDSWGSTLWK